MHLRQKRLKELESRWWERVRSDTTVESCNRPYKHEDDNGEANLEVDFEEEWNGCSDKSKDKQVDGEYENEEAGDYGDDLDAGLGSDSDSDANSQDELVFDNGVDRPKGLWGFSSESPSPALLLAC